MTNNEPTTARVIAAAKAAVQRRIEAYEEMVKWGDISRETGENCLTALRGAAFWPRGARAVVCSAPSARNAYLVCECLDAGSGDVEETHTEQAEISGDGPSFVLTW
jgi:hypothetical protein